MRAVAADMRAVLGIDVETGQRNWEVYFRQLVDAAEADELIQGLTGFRGGSGMTHNRIRRFDRMEDRAMTCRPVPSCPMCGSEAVWGRGDVNPFLGVIG